MDELEKYPELDQLAGEIARCGRCGFCQNVCPVYQVTGHEGGVARGRNMCAKELISGGLELSRENEAFFTECLLCRACVDTCFSGVKTDDIVLAGRRARRRTRGISPIHKYIFRDLLADHERLGRFIRFAAIANRVASPEIASTLRMFGWLGITKASNAVHALERTGSFLSDIPKKFLRERLSSENPLNPNTAGARRAGPIPNRADKVPKDKTLDSGTGSPPSPALEKGGKKVFAALFIGCGTNFMFPQVGEATIALLEMLGYEAAIVNHGCCGLPAFAHGALDEAMSLAARNVQAFSNLSECVIVTDCSSCASFLKEYPRLFAPSNAAANERRSEAEQFSSRVRDITEIIANAQNPLSLPLPKGDRERILRVTFHDPCHLSRYQRLAHMPRAALRSLPGIEFLEMKEADWCCGGAGAFAVEHPDISLRVLERKIENVQASGAEIVATTCPACLMQLRRGLAAEGLKTRAMHLVEIVRECF